MEENIKKIELILIRTSEDINKNNQTVDHMVETIAKLNNERTEI